MSSSSNSTSRLVRISAPFSGRCSPECDPWEDCDFCSFPSLPTTDWRTFHPPRFRSWCYISILQTFPVPRCAPSFFPQQHSEHPAPIPKPLSPFRAPPLLQPAPWSLSDFPKASAGCRVSALCCFAASASCDMRHDRVLAGLAVEDARKQVASRNPLGCLFLFQHSHGGWICLVRDGGRFRHVDVLAVPCHRLPVCDSGRNGWRRFSSQGVCQMAPAGRERHPLSKRGEVRPGRRAADLLLRRGGSGQVCRRTLIPAGDEFVRDAGLPYPGAGKPAACGGTDGKRRRNAAAACFRREAAARAVHLVDSKPCV